MTKVSYTSSRGEHEITHASPSFFNGGMEISWGAEGIGFGSLTILQDIERGSIQIDSEMMSPDFVAKVLEKMAQNALYRDFEKLNKNIKEIGLEEADKLLNFRPHVLFSPFYEDKDKENENLWVRRWRLKENKVLNVWFNKAVIAPFNAEYYQLDMKFGQEKSMAFGFVKAELWTWDIEKIERNKN